VSGSTGTVQEIDEGSVLLRHADGQLLWWPYRALTMLQPAPAAPKARGGEDARRASSTRSHALGAWAGVRACAVATCASCVVNFVCVCVCVCVCE